MLGKHLEAALAAAVADVQTRRHEYLTLEHLLMAITEERYGEEILESCGIDVLAVQRRIEDFFKTYMSSLPEGGRIEVVQTLAVQRVLQRAMRQIKDAGRDTMEIGDVLASMLEEDSYAGYFLLSQGITRVALLEVISHVKPARRESRSQGDGDKVVGDGEDSGEGGENHEKVLQQYTTDLTARARSGQIDPLIGRSRELNRTIQVLSRRRKNNPLYVGDPGVGKTALAEGLALRIVNGDVPDIFTSARVFSLDMGSLLAGSKYRGDFEGRLKAVMAALQSIPNSIMVIDEIHTIVGAGATTGGAMDASNILKPVLASGKLRCIGSTTHEEYRNHFEKDRALSRRFQKIDIVEPSEDECVAILKGLKERYEEYHNVKYTQPALRAAVALSIRHLQDRLLPDKAIDVIDEAGAAMRLARAARGAESRLGTVGVTEVEKVIASMARIPSVKVSTSDRDRLRTLEADLATSVFGQQKAVEILTRAVLRARAGFGGQGRPQGSFLFYGPTGVGKTELAKQLATSLDVPFLRYDMSEYMEKHAVARLIGAPPGYVGFDQGGLLTEAVRKTPHCVLLLDEIEKAHPDIFNILLQVMDYATLTDNTGRKTDFRNVVIIMTSNAGAFEMNKRGLGFTPTQAGDASAAKGRKAVEKLFSPEFRNRLDAMVPFANLSQDVMGRIVDKFTKQLAAALKEKRVTMTLTAGGRAWLAAKGYDPAFGARPLARIMREHVEDELASEVLFGKLAAGGRVTVDALSLTAEKLTFIYGPAEMLGPGANRKLLTGRDVKALPRGGKLLDEGNGSGAGVDGGESIPKGKKAPVKRAAASATRKTAAKTPAKVTGKGTGGKKAATKKAAPAKKAAVTQSGGKG